MIAHPRISIEAEDLADPTAPVSEGLLLSSSVDEVLLIDPVLGEEIGDIAASNVADAETTIKRFREYENSGRWVAMSADERASLLERLAGVFDGHADAIAELGTLESGTPTQFSHQIHVAAPRDLIQASAENALVDSGSHDGSSVAIIGYHQPLIFSLTTVMRALAQGRPSIIIASPLAPLTTIAFMNCLLEADLPKGAVHMIIGSESVINFTLANMSPELIDNSAPGGSSSGPIPIFVGADGIAEESALTVCRNALLGHYTVPGRLPGVTHLVVSSQEADSYHEAMTEVLNSMVIGDPWESTTDVGPLIRPQEAESVAAYVNALRDLGGNVDTGSQSEEPEIYATPTVIRGLTDPRAAMNNSLCAPIAVTFDSVNYAN